MGAELTTQNREAVGNPLRTINEIDNFLSEFTRYANNRRATAARPQRLGDIRSRTTLIPRTLLRDMYNNDEKQKDSNINGTQKNDNVNTEAQLL